GEDDSEDGGSEDGSDDEDESGDDAQDADEDEAEDDAGSEDDGDSAGAADLEDSQLLLVMDASGSMDESDTGGTTRIEAARDALHGVVDGLDDEDEVGLRVFSSEITDPDASGACEDSELVVPIGGDNRDELTEAIDSYDAVGGRTPLAHALEEAAEDLGEDGRRTIVLVSDGEDNCAPDPCEVAETLASHGIDLTIHTVGYEVEDEAREQLQCIAAAGDGEYYDAADAESLDHALERVSKRAFQPFTLSGEQVTGAANWGDAPTLESGTQYIDEFSEDTLHYRIPREMDRSSLHVGLTTHNDPENSDWVEVRIETWDGDVCAQSRMVGQSMSTRNFLRTMQATAAYDPESTDDEDPCTEDDELVLAVELDDFIEDPQTVDQAFELLIAEEPEAEDADSLEPAVERETHSWEDMGRDPAGAEDVVGGSSFNDAPLLEPGTTYDGDILPGETLVFRVPVEWGERLQAEAFFPQSGGALRERVQDVSTVGLTLMSPMKGVAGSDFGSLFSTMDTDLQAMTPEVRWNNRHSFTEHISSSSIDGEYYLVVAADQTDSGDSFPVPYRLTVQTFGDSGEGEPQRPSGEELLFPDRADEQTREPEDPSDSEYPSDSDD
ncbi:MAG: VWA domain-containing protein, partial [Nesterenkonia sp.]|nr:VWA domain-containing protein [Nesterenkonia sp.]